MTSGEAKKQNGGDFFLQSQLFTLNPVYGIILLRIPPQLAAGGIHSFMSEMISGLESSRGSAIPTREYVSEVVSLLNRSEDIGADRKVAQGYRDLFTAIFTSSSNPEDSSVKAMHVLTPQELKELKKTVNTLFLQCTLMEPTSFYRSKKTGKTYEHWGLEYKDVTLNPTQVFIIVNKFGLVDGVRKTHTEIGESLGFTKGRSRQLTFRALRKLRNSEMFKKLASDIF